MDGQKEFVAAQYSAGAARIALQDEPPAMHAASSAASCATRSSGLYPGAECVTGDESMTGAQASYLGTLAEEAGEAVDETLTKAEASKRIDELQARTGRGRDH